MFKNRNFVCVNCNAKIFSDKVVQMIGEKIMKTGLENYVIKVDAASTMNMKLLELIKYIGMICQCLVGRKHIQRCKECGKMKVLKSY